MFTGKYTNKKQVKQNKMAAKYWSPVNIYSTASWSLNQKDSIKRKDMFSGKWWSYQISGKNYLYIFLMTCLILKGLPPYFTSNFKQI